MKKSWLTGFVSVVLGFSLAVSSAAAVPFVLGDLTNDGDVTEEDSAVLKRYFAGHYREKIPFDIDKADVDGDGYLTRQDGMRLARYTDGWKSEREYFYSKKTGFSVNPQIVEDGTVGYKAGLAGTVYYYYSKDGKNPDTDEFSANYDYISANYKGEIQTNGMYETMNPEEAYTASYPYMVFRFVDETGKKYTPVTVDTSDKSADDLEGNGFSTVPYLADETTIKFIAAQAGTIYWCYLKDGKELTAAEFKKIYAETAGTHCGNAIISSGRTLSFALKGSYLEEYPYVAFMIKNKNNACYVPVILPVGDNGFVDKPALKNVGTVSFKSSISGMLYYYYSETSDLPAPDDFKGEYNKAEVGKYIDVTKNKVDTFDYDVNESEDYPYLIIALRNSDGYYMQPIALNINYQTGFRNLPEIVDEGTIQFRTEDGGEVMYYYSKSDTVLSSSQFREHYDTLANRYKYTIDVDDVWEKIEYNMSYASDYPYMVLMFIDNQGTEYTPYVFDLNTTFNTGFIIAPYIIDDAVYFKTESAGEVWYFYAKTELSLAASEFEEEFDDARYYSTETVRAGSLDKFELDGDILDDYPYIVLAFLPEDNEDTRKFCFPVVLDIEEGTAGGTGLSVDSITADEVVVTTDIDGKVYWYFSNTSSVNSDKFESRYEDASDYDYENCDDGEEIKIPVDEDDGYSYLVVCIKVTNADGKEVYLTPVVVDLDERTSDKGEEDDGSTTNKTGLEHTSMQDDYNNHILKFISHYDGTVTITLKAGIIEQILTTISVSKDESYEYNYSAIYDMLTGEYLSQLVGSGKAAYIKLQLKTASDTYRTISIPIVD
ncbi:MAG: hypothetical protein E7579_01570 [Ruminococcaceae bacterium]|nr:hypothetical protein [Oscillospiraceae bacterium]